MTTTVVKNLVFRAFFEKQRLTGWYCNLWIVLSVEDKLPFLEQPIPAMPVKASKEIVGLILMTMDPDIQKNLEQLGAYDMLKELKMLYAQQAKQKLLQIVREFHACKQEEGQFVSSYVLKMKSYIDNLERLSHAMTQNLTVSLILVSLRKEYGSFVQNYNMHGMGKTGLRRSRKLKPGALSLYVGDGHRAAIEAIGSYHFCLPISRNGIFQTDLSNSNTNDSSMYVVSNKRANTNLDSTLLWHCHLGHISKKRIEKLQHDRLLNSTDNKSFDKCVSCMSGKMARKPYTQVEMAKDLLGLIHTDICGPFRTVSK
ncbi:zinc finger, CCHC-type containing protein [Tanacetum coccineum]|uniref:Zinc finger, CCHC-type containing protein n=1 Tax=Tanacetum coccineum TaxID=301880 RepID=A0ABQ5B3T8_9ASTR